MFRQLAILSITLFTSRILLSEVAPPVSVGLAAGVAALAVQAAQREEEAKKLEQQQKEEEAKRAREEAAMLEQQAKAMMEGTKSIQNRNQAAKKGDDSPMPPQPKSEDKKEESKGADNKEEKKVEAPTPSMGQIAELKIPEKPVADTPIAEAAAREPQSRSTSSSSSASRSQIERAQAQATAQATQESAQRQIESMTARNNSIVAGLRAGQQTPQSRLLDSTRPSAGETQASAPRRSPTRGITPEDRMSDFLVRNDRGIRGSNRSQRRRPRATDAGARETAMLPRQWDPPPIPPPSGHAP